MAGSCVVTEKSEAELATRYLTFAREWDRRAARAATEKARESAAKVAESYRNLARAVVGEAQAKP
jgi:hypothetical protein